MGEPGGNLKEGGRKGSNPPEEEMKGEEGEKREKREKRGR